MKAADAPRAETPQPVSAAGSARPDPTIEESVADRESVREHVLAAAEAKASEEIGPGKRRATRVADGAMLGGVCTGLARHLGWPVMVIRIGFVVLITQFIGVIAYGALWLLMPPESSVQTADRAPGLAVADRRGLRSGDPAAGDAGPGGRGEADPKSRRTHRGVDAGVLVALTALGAGLLWIVQISGLGISQKIFWPVAFACAGAALVWRQADTARQQQWKAEAGGRVWLAPFVARGGWPAIVRTVLGLGLVGAAFGLVIAGQNDLQLLPEVLAMTVLALAGLAIVLAPWLYRSRSALNEARSAEGPRRRPSRHGCPPARLGAADAGPDPAAVGGSEIGPATGSASRT